MDDLTSTVGSVRASAHSVRSRSHPMGLSPLLCFGDSGCLYGDPSSATGYVICTPDGACETLAACAEGHAFAPTGTCVEVGGACGEVVDHEVYAYDGSGVCSPSGACEPEWSWMNQRCEYSLAETECKVPGSDDRVWRYDIDANCTVRDECKTQAFSASEKRCVRPDTECGPPVDHRLQKYDGSGACVLATECAEDWDFSDNVCKWRSRYQACDPSPEQVALDDKRLFEFDVNGACVSSQNRCVEGWDFDGELGRCAFGLRGTEFERRDGRVYVYDARMQVVPGECVADFEEVEGSCLYADRGAVCRTEHGAVHKWTAAGECVATGECSAPNMVFRASDGTCTAKPELCPPVNGYKRAMSFMGRCVDSGGCADGYRQWAGRCIPKCAAGSFPDSRGGCVAEGEECARDKPAPGHVWRVTGGKCVEANVCHGAFMRTSDGRCVPAAKAPGCGYHISDFRETGPRQYTMSLGIAGNSSSCIRRAEVYGLRPSDQIRVSLSVSGPKKCDRVVQFRSENHFSIHQQVGTSFGYTSSFKSGYNDVYRIYCDMRCMAGTLTFTVVRAED